MQRITTYNSVYEVEGLAVRQVSTAPGFVPTLPIGEWISFDAVEIVRNWFAEPARLLATSLHGPNLITSPIVSTEYLLDEEGDDVPEPEPCQFIIEQETRDTPPIFCDEDAEEGSELCAKHLRGEYT